MSKTGDLKKEIKSKIDIIKKINDNSNIFGGNVNDTYLNDLKDKDKDLVRNLDSFQSKTGKKKVNKTDIFSELVSIVSDFVGIDEKVSTTDSFQVTSKLKTYAIDSAEKTISLTKDYVLEEVKNTFFSNSDGLCGVETLMLDDSMVMSPKEFDFLNILKLDPESDMGTIMYEPLDPDLGNIKMNREFYNTFTTSPFEFNSPNNNILFTLNWDNGNQRYNITGLKQDNDVRLVDFLNDYYSTIEIPNINDVIQSSMALVLKGNDVPREFDISLNFLNRLASKILSVCGNESDDSLKQNAIDEFNENDQNISSYFDFDDVEGIDLDDEADRLNKVLRFTDCGNFTTPINPNLFENYSFLTAEAEAEELVDDILADYAKDIYSSEDLNISIKTLNLSLIEKFITTIPKALISTVLTPKFVFPIAIIWKQLRGIDIDVKDLLKELNKLFFNVLSKIFWNFITQFWSFVKKDLITFLGKLTSSIIANKYKRYVTIITSIIDIIKKILTTSIGSCNDLFTIMSKLINGALSINGPKTPIPGILLGFSDLLPGYSEDRALMNISERLEKAGIDLSPINGESNDITTLVKSVIDGNTEELDKSSYVKAANKIPITVVGADGVPVIIPSGMISVSGKLF